MKHDFIISRIALPVPASLFSSLASLFWRQRSFGYKGGMFLSLMLALLAILPCESFARGEELVALKDVTYINRYVRFRFVRPPPRVEPIRWPKYEPKYEPKPEPRPESDTKTETKTETELKLDVIEPLMREAREKNVYFIANEAMKEYLKGSTKYKILLPDSASPSELLGLYDINLSQLSVLRKSIDGLKNQKDVVTFNNKDVLKKAIETIKAEGAEPVIIYSSHDSTLFGQKISEYGIKNILTCNSYRLEVSHAFQSTDYIEIDSLFKSISASSESANLYDFYSSVSSHYASFMKAQNRRAFIYVTSGEGGLGAIAYAIYKLNEEK